MKHLWHFGQMWLYKDMVCQLPSPLLGEQQLPLQKDIYPGTEQPRMLHRLLDRLEMDPRGFSVIACSCKVQKRSETINQKIKS